MKTLAEAQQRFPVGSVWQLWRPLHGVLQTVRVYGHAPHPQREGEWVVRWEAISSRGGFGWSRSHHFREIEETKHA